MLIQQIHSAHSLDDLVKTALTRHVAAAKSGAVRALVDQRNNVELLGQVGSWYQKQLAQESLLALPEIAHLQNNIAVVYQSTSGNDADVDD